MNLVWKVLIVTGPLILGLSQEKGAQGQGESRKRVVSALEQTISKGTVFLKGRLEKERPTEAEMGGILLDVSTGPEVEGAFSARLGKNGVVAVDFASDKFRYEIFYRGSKRAHRLSWSEGGAPMPAEAAHDLSRLLRWDQVLKHLGKEKDFKALTDTKVNGENCRVLAGPLSAELIPHPKKGSADEKDDPWDWQVESISAVFLLGKEDGLIRRMEIKVNRRVDADPGQEPIDCLNRYILTVEKCDPTLDVEVPPELEKLMH